MFHPSNIGISFKESLSYLKSYFVGEAVLFGGGCIVGLGWGGSVGAAATAIVGGEGAIPGGAVGCVGGGSAASVVGVPANATVNTLMLAWSVYDDLTDSADQLRSDLKACSVIP